MGRSHYPDLPWGAWEGQAGHVSQWSEQAYQPWAPGWAGRVQEQGARGGLNASMSSGRARASAAVSSENYPSWLTHYMCR